MTYSFNYEQYKKRLNKKHFSSFFILIPSIAILFCLAFFLYPHKTKNYEFYMVELASFQTYSMAITFANQIKEKQGAGYVYFESTYRVFACNYNKKKDAEKVVENLKTDYPQACVYSIKTNSIKISNALNKQQKNCIEKTLDCLSNCIKEISSLSVEFDKANLSLSKVGFYINNFYKEFQNEYSQFKTTFNTDSKYNVAKDCLYNIDCSFTQLTSLKTEQDFANNFKYLVIDVIVNFNSFANCFN